MSGIDTKSKFYELWLSGQLGNRMGAWTGDKYLPAEVDRLPFVGIRSMTPGGPFKMPVLPEDIRDVLCSMPGPLSQYVVCEGTPEQYNPSHPCQLMSQGEIQTHEGAGLYYYHSTSKLPMRDALIKHGAHAQGAAVTDYLRRACTPGSYSDLQDLLEKYPGHVIELSIYTRCLGNVPHRNTIVWEVRNY